jgi:hypothetical protein
MVNVAVKLRVKASADRNSDVQLVMIEVQDQLRVLKFVLLHACTVSGLDEKFCAPSILSVHALPSKYICVFRL